MKKWIVKSSGMRVAGDIAQQSGLGMFCSEVLAARNITDIDEINSFLNPTVPENPFIMKNMREAVETINNAVDTGEKICVFGDYDCDGIVSTVMLVSYLECIGADVSYYIPERSEGYGMNESAVRKIAAEGAGLVITVDNGISALKEAELIYQLGMKLVITDHHQPGEVLPKAEAVVDAHRTDCPSSFKDLCGAGVVLKLISAIEGGDYSYIIEQFGDIAAIATIGDIVNIRGENRYIVQKGLEVLENTERQGLVSLMRNCSLQNGKISSSSVAFGIVPRINASGRFASPSLAAELLMCEDEERASQIADELSSLNNQRKQAENDIVMLIEKYINANPSCINKRVLVFNGNGWHHGVIGIAASRISERFGKPCFIITNEDDEMSRGSARSFGDFSVFKCLDFCSDILVKFGGHMGAGGFSLKTADIEAFDIRIQKYAAQYHDIMPVYSITADKLIRPDEIIVENIESLSLLEPFGEGNNEPVFIISGALVKSIKPISNGLHSKLSVLYGDVMLDVLIFRISPGQLGICAGERWSFMVEMGINNYRNNKSVSVIARDYRKYGVKQDKYILSKNLYERYSRDEISEQSILKEICPSKQELTLVYKYLGNTVQNTDNMYSNLESAGISFCKLRICLDIFNELGLIKFDYSNDSVIRIPVNTRVNLENSAILRRLQQQL